MLILGIETSCDETSVAVVENGTLVRSCVISSSGKDFEKMGGVIPEEAARKQSEVILPVLTNALRRAGIQIKDVHAIAVTNGPGLLGSLLVGSTTARTLCHIAKKPLIPVHHTLGHLSSIWLRSNQEGEIPLFPNITLSVSGGHSDLWYRNRHTEGKLIGSTIDDAAGEAFDKGAVQLGLPYPGGPALAKLGENGDRSRFSFPIPLKGNGIRFSFSGLKTALKYTLRDLKEPLNDGVKKDIAASYEHAICSHLCDKLDLALDEYNDAKEIHIVGGVSANKHLREMTKELGLRKGIKVRFPESIEFCTDNGAMIAAAGYFLLQEKPSILSQDHIQTRASVSLEDVFRG